MHDFFEYLALAKTNPASVSAPSSVLDIAFPIKGAAGGDGDRQIHPCTGYQSRPPGVVPLSKDLLPPPGFSNVYVSLAWSTVGTVLVHCLYLI